MPRDEGSVASLVRGGRCHGAAGELSAAAEARVWLWCEQAGPWAPRGAEARGPAACGRLRGRPRGRPTHVPCTMGWTPVTGGGRAVVQVIQKR